MPEIVTQGGQAKEFQHHEVAVFLGHDPSWAVLKRVTLKLKWRLLLHKLILQILYHFFSRSTEQSKARGG